MCSRNCGTEEWYKTHASQLTDNLFLAACRAVTSKCLLELGITNIVNATLELPTVAYQQQETIQIAVEDRITAKLNIYFDLIADKIQQVHRGGGKILVYCRAGQSRSATLCIAYFMKYHNMTYEEAFQFVKYRRPIIHPNLGFVHQLKDYEKKLKTRIPTVFAETSVLEEEVDNEVIDIPIPPIKHGRATVTLHEPFKSLTDKYEIVPVQICDRNSFKSRRAGAGGPERCSLNVQPGHPVASTSIIPKTVERLKDQEILQNRGKRKTAFTRLTKPNEIAVSLLDIPLDLALASNSYNSKLTLQTKAEHSSSAITELLHPVAISQGFLAESLGDSQKILETPVKARKVVTALRSCVTQHVTCLLDSNRPISPDQAARSGPAGRVQRQASVKRRSLLRHGSSGYSLTKPLTPVTRQEVKTSPVTSPARAVSVRSVQHSLVVTPVQPLQLTSPLPSFSVSRDSYHKLDFSFTPFDTSCIALVTSQQTLGDANIDVGNKMTISKEFPYYSVVHFTSALELFRATENAKLDTQWFNLPSAVKADPVELVRKTSEARMAERRKKVSQLDLKWATDRFQTDEFQKPLPSLAVTQFSSCKATSSQHRRSQESYILTELVDYFKLDIIGRFYVPHYNPSLLRKNCDYVLHPVAGITEPTILEMTNIYSPPRGTHFKAVARKSLHLDCPLAAVTFTSDIRSHNETLENIPDEIHDISEMKDVLAEKSNSPRCKIWFEVFKRTLMKKRPTFANVTYSRFLSIPSSSEHLVLEFFLATIANTSDFKVTPTTCVGKSALCIASTREVRVVERFNEFLQKSSQRTKPRYVSPSDYSQDYLTAEALETTSKMSASVLGLGSVLFGRAVSKVSFPNRLYTVREERVYGQVGKYSPNALLAFSRVPFSVITKLRPVPDNHLPLRLGVTASLSEYKYVGDVEEQADLTVHKVSVCQVATLTETDSFWFFSLDTAATAAIEEKNVTNNNSSNFLLFLPDRKFAPKIGQEELPQPDNVPTSELKVINPDAVVAEVISEIKEQTEVPPPVDKRVTFSSKIEMNEEDTEESGRKQKVKTIYYGRDRSKSRTRLKDVETGKRLRRRDRSASSYNEAEVMRNLEKSVDEANSILLRRKEESGSTSRHTERLTFSPSPERFMSPRLETRSEERFARRSRDAQRNREETERRERSRRSDQNSQPNQAQTQPPTISQTDETGKTLAGGIISFASNLLTGRSRRENSETRARGLLRKSARNFL